MGDVAVTTCQICERAIKLKDGPTLAHHGYRRPGRGWQTGSCMGARELPYEVSCEVLKRYRRTLEEARETHTALAQGPVDRLYLDVDVDHRGRLPHYERREVTEANLADVVASHRRFAELNVGTRWPPRAPTWAELVERYRADHRRRAEDIGRELSRAEARIAAWKPPAVEVAV